MKTGNEILTELFKNYRTTLLNICISKGLSEADSEDVISEAFCRFWTDFDQMKDLEPLQHKKWLYKAVNNICHERLREKIKIADDDIGEYREIIADKRNDIDIVIEDHEFDLLVEQFEAELTGPEKKAFRVLIDKDSGASYVELSAEYDLPISTLTSLTSRLRKKAVRILDKILKR